MSTSIESRKKLEAFKQAFTTGIEGIVSAAKIYVEAIDDNPKNADLFRDEFVDWIPEGAWAGWEAVGRKWMHPKLLMGGGGRFSNKIKRLPYSTQERIFDGEKFPLMTATGDTLNVDIRNITTEQAEQLFDGSHIRSLPQQKAYMESRKTSVVEEVSIGEVLPYKIVGCRVHFRKDCVMTRDELKTLALTV